MWWWPGWMLKGLGNGAGLSCLLSLLDFFFLLELKFRYFFIQEQQDTFPLQKVLKVADVEREFGNYLFRKQCFEGAKDRYKRV